MSGIPVKTMSLSTPNSPTSDAAKHTPPDIPRSISPTGSSSSLDTFPELPPVVPQLHPQVFRSSKRSSSTSNDLLYERDRFRARLQTFNVAKEDANKPCEVCDIIESKTAKLAYHDEVSPLDPQSAWFQTLKSVDDYAALHPNIDIKGLTMPDLEKVFKWYFKRPLPDTTEMFPWLHGLHPDNFAQRQFFIQQQLSYIKDPLSNIDSKPQARFLMCVNSDLASNDHVLTNSISVDEILTPIDVSRSEVQAALDEILAKVFGSPASELGTLPSTFMKDIGAVNYLPVFSNLDPDRGVSLRNFQIQVTKSCICSDIIVYCTSESNVQHCHSLARLLWLAQQFERVVNSLSSMDYNVFVVKLPETPLNRSLTSVNLSSPFMSKNFDLNKAVKCSCKFLTHWDNEYVIKEKIETLKMSGASKVLGSLYSGNHWDYQNFVNHKYLKTDFSPQGVSATHQYCNPTNSIITSRYDPEDLIETVLPHSGLDYKLLVNCFNEAKFPDLSTLQNLLKSFSQDKPTGDYYCLNFPPSGSVGLGDCKKDNILSIVNTCKFMYLLSMKLGYNVLIYCSDGYTESSLLNLFYTVYATNCSVSEAIIDLHVKYGRPFYIFNTDVTILNKIEPFLRQLSPVGGKPIQWDDLDVLTHQEINEVLLSPSTLSPSLKLGFIEQVDEYDSSSSESSSDTVVEIDWCKEVEGSLPSRILPYMYLGSLRHANCVPLLNKLGITKIISVGEPLDWINGARFQSNNDISIQELNGGDIEIFTIKPKTDQPHTVDQIMKVNNLQDDGIDQLESSLPIILRYIDEEYKRSNGTTKFLVHCRVGVSRSATVVIAEVMERLKVNLPQAYLYVRVRRLNIIIQPNLKFMYELFKWEEKKRQAKEKLREIDWFGMCRQITLLNNPYLGN